MRRVVVVGAGFFGSLVAQRLYDVGVAPLVAARRSGDVRLDAEDEASLAAALRPGDVIVDTAGPFAHRTTRLLRMALDRGCDVVDLSESLAWAQAVLALDDRARAAGSAVFPACSAVTAVTGACVSASGVAAPLEIDQFLAPASAETASPATRSALVRSVGRPIRTLRGGGLVEVRGYRQTRVFPDGVRHGGLVEHAGAALLPRAWPGLRRAELWVDPNALFARAALSFASRIDPLAAIARTLATRVGPGPLGRRDGAFVVLVRAGDATHTVTFCAPRGCYRIAVEPAVVVAEALGRGTRREAGVMLPDRQVEPDALFARLRALDITISEEVGAS